MIPHIDFISQKSPYYIQGYRWKVKTNKYTLCVSNFIFALKIWIQEVKFLCK